MKNTFILFGLFIAMSCSPKTAPNENQGITGQVTWSAGNQMPGPDRKESGQKGIQREVLFYELTHKSQAEGQGPIYNKINSKLIRKMMTDSNGIFNVELPEGGYSVFVKEKDGYYANSFDTHNIITPVDVVKGEMKKITININYLASY